METLKLLQDNKEKVQFSLVIGRSSNFGPRIMKLRIKRPTFYLN